MRHRHIGTERAGTQLLFYSVLFCSVLFCPVVFCSFLFCAVLCCYTHTSEYGYAIEHPVYISVVMQRVQQSCRRKSVFGAVHVDVEYAVKFQLRFSLTNVHFVGPHYRRAKSFP